MKIMKFKNLEWIVLEENNNKTKLLLKDVLDEERIKKYSNDDWYIDGEYVCHTSNIRPPFVWEDSYIKNVILKEFKKDLNIDCDIDLLSKEEVEQLDKDIRECDKWYWTKSAYTDQKTHYADAWIVSRNGYLDYYTVTYTSYGVRPVINLESKFLSENKEVLDKEEKEYLSAVIKPFRNRVLYVSKHRNFGISNDFIEIRLKNYEEWMFPYFEKGTMYKGMEADKEYTLEELGL